MVVEGRWVGAVLMGRGGRGPQEGFQEAVLFVVQMPLVQEDLVQSGMAAQHGPVRGPVGVDHRVGASPQGGQPVKGRKAQALGDVRWEGGEQVVQDNLTCIRRGLQETFEVPREVIFDESMDEPTVTTAESSGFFSREMMVCQALII